MKKQNLFSRNWAMSLPLAAALMLGACNQDNQDPNPDPQPDELTSTQMAQADQAINDAIGTVDDALDGTLDGLGNTRTETCATLALNRQQRTLSIDFGTGCEGPFGRRRTGRITVSFTETQRTITFLAYSVENTSLSGTLTVSNLTRTGNSITYNTSSSDLVVANGDRRVAFTRLQRQTQVNLGTNPRRVGDNEVRITGTAAGTNGQGKAFTSEITTPILFRQACFQSGVYYPVSGIMVVQESGQPGTTINYGDGACDRTVTLTVGRITRTITLP
jgi:hypothetical protein